MDFKLNFDVFISGVPSTRMLTRPTPSTSRMVPHCTELWAHPPPYLPSSLGRWPGSINSPCWRSRMTRWRASTGWTSTAGSRTDRRWRIRWICTTRAPVVPQGCLVTPGAQGRRQDKIFQMEPRVQQAMVRYYLHVSLY